MKHSGIFATLVVLFFVLGIGFSATTFAPAYTPLPVNNGPSAADILANFSFNEKFAEVNTNLANLKSDLVSLHAGIDAQTNAFNILAGKEELRFLQAEAIKRSDERIQSQLAGYRLFTLLAVTFCVLFCIFLLRKTLDDFKNEMKKQIRTEVEADLHKQVRAAIIPTKEEAKKKKPAKEDEASPIAVPAQQAPQIAQAPATPAEPPKPAPKKEGFFARLFKKKETPKLPADLERIKQQLLQDSQTLPMKAYPDVTPEPQVAAPHQMTPDERLASIERTMEGTQRQIQALLQRTKPPVENKKPQSQVKKALAPKKAATPTKEPPKRTSPTKPKAPAKRTLPPELIEKEVEVDLTGGTG